MAFAWMGLHSLRGWSLLFEELKDNNVHRRNYITRVSMIEILVLLIGTSV